MNGSGNTDVSRRRISVLEDAEVTSTMAGAGGAVLGLAIAWAALALLAPATSTDAAICAFAVGGALGFVLGTSAAQAWRRARPV